MKIMQTTTGVLAIVGLGYLAGVGHALVREKPVILGVDAPINIPTQEDNQSEPDQSQPGQANPIADDTDTAPAISTPVVLSGDPEFNARLDAPVPDGMLTLRQAHQMWIDGAYFIDSRLRDEYDAGHVSLAAYLTAETIFSAEGETEMQGIPPDAPVVIYCIGGEECDASKNTKALLEQFGYTDLSIMGVGYDEWAAAGLPTSLSDDSTEEGSP